MSDVYVTLAKIKACKDDAVLLELVSELALTLVQNNYPYVPKIISQVTKINEGMNGNGVVHLELKMYDGKVTEGVFHEITKFKF